LRISTIAYVRIGSIFSNYFTRLLTVVDVVAQIFYMKKLRHRQLSVGLKICSRRMLQINSESTWITDKMAVGAVAFMCSVTRTDLGQISMSPNLIRETTPMDRIYASFRFRYFILPRLFEKHFYTK